MKKTIQLYFFISTVILGSTSTAQVNLNSISLQVGVINGIETSNPVLYPEAQFGGFFGKPFIQWFLYWGYWDDGVNTVTITDNIVYSYHGQIVGARIFFFPSLVAEHWPLPIALFGGIAHHFIGRTYVGGEDYFWGIGSDGTEASNTVEAGLRAYFKIVESLELRGEVHQFFRLGNQRVDMSQRDRRGYTVGLALLL